jgi:hypothetical protein
MNKTYLDTEPAAPSAAGTMEVINPSTEPITAKLADHDQQVESAHLVTQKISQQKLVSAARKGRQWYQRLLESAAQNPPHPL